MLEKLVIYLHAHTLTQPSWVVMDADGAFTQEIYHGDAHALHALAANRDVIVIVPPESILLTSITLPKMNRARLAKALPFALEEQLVDDVDTLHFACGEFQAENTLPVAIVAREKMQSWMDLLKEWNVQPDMLVPLTLALPLTENTWHIAVDDVAAVRTAPYQGFACDHANLMAFLNLAMSSNGSVPNQISIHNITKEALAPTLKITSKVEEEFLTPMQLIGLLARAVNATPALNLLQGEFTVKKNKLPQMEKLQKAAIYLVASWVALLFLYPTISYIVLKIRVVQLNSQIAQIYQHNFPQASSMVAPKLRMDDKLRKLEASMGENRLLLLLGYIGKGLSASENVKLKRLDFQGSQLTIELSAVTSEDFSTFADYLSQEGLSVKQQNATLSGTRVNATLQIE